jgi:hypothetical protein
MEKMKKAGKKPRNATRFATAAAACAIAFTLALANCDTDTDADYDDLTPGLDRTTRQYSIILPEAGASGGVSANPNPAKLGTAITVNYIPPVTAEEETARAAENTTSYTITSLTGTYNNGQKTVNFSKGGGGDVSSPCPTLM